MRHHQALNDFPFFRQGLHEAHFTNQHLRERHVEADNFERVVGQLFLDHVEVERYLFREPAGVLGRAHGATVRFQQGTVFLHAEYPGELHEAEIPFGFLIRESGRPFHPIGKSDQPLGFDETGGFGNQFCLVFNITPGVLAPDKIELAGRQLGRTGVSFDKGNFFRQAFLRAAFAPQVHHRAGGVHAGHARHLAKPHQKTHSRAEGATEVNPRPAFRDAGAFRQVHRGGQPAEVDLLAHEELPEPAFGTAVNRLHICQSNILDRFHTMFLFVLFCYFQNSHFVVMPHTPLALWFATVPKWP